MRPAEEWQLALSCRTDQGHGTSGNNVTLAGEGCRHGRSRAEGVWRERARSLTGLLRLQGAPRHSHRSSPSGHGRIAARLHALVLEGRGVYKHVLTALVGVMKPKPFAELKNLTVPVCRMT